MADKIYSPKEAALMVLAKAQELYKLSSLSKSEDLKKGYEGFEKVKESAAKSGASDPAAVAAAVGMKKYGKKAFEEHAHEGKKFKKDEDMGGGSAMAMSEENPDEKEDAELGEHVEREVEAHEEGNEDPKHEMKGHIKLAKFMGRMEHKKGEKAKSMEKAETGYEKGVNTAAKGLSSFTHDTERRGTSASAGSNLGGVSEAGQAVRNSKAGMASPNHGKNVHRETLAQIHQMSKPKLP
jgi:hypothetical protein